MSKLSDYITGKIGFPIQRTGISHNSFEIRSWKRKKDNIVYKCSFCDCEILPDDSMQTHTSRGYTVEMPKPEVLGGGMQNEFEVLGFICGKCSEEISEYDNLYYG